MVTLETVNNALKNVYLAVVSDQLNNNTDAVLTKIKQTTSDVWGKEIIKNVYFEDKTLTFKEDLANIYASIEISDKAIRCCSNSAGAFVNLLNDEIESMVANSQKRLRNAFYTEDTKPDYLPKEAQFNPVEICGLKELFDIKSEKLYGLKRKEHKELNPKIEKIDKFDPIKIQEIIDNNNDEVDIIVCSSKIRRYYMQYLTEHLQEIEVQELGGGFKGMVFNNSLIMITAPIPDNEIYLLNTKDFTFHQLCDWEWLEDENGKILKQLDRPVYKATLVKYGNIMCYKPSKQIKVIIDTK